MNFWKITKKDVRLILRDRRTLFVLLALPLSFISILGLSAGQLFSQKEKSKKFRVGVVNADTSVLSAKLLAEVVKMDALEVSELSDRDEAKELLADGKIELLAFIGPHTTAKKTARLRPRGSSQNRGPTSFINFSSPRTR